MNLEKGRYCLFVAKSCPFALRTEIVRNLKSLQEYVSVHYCDPVFEFTGWKLKYDYADNLNNIFEHKTIKELYLECEPERTQSFTIPILYDKVDKRIISNESSDIIKIFNAVTDVNNLDLYPEELKSRIDTFCVEFDQRISRDTYRAGHAKTQEEYDTLFDAVFEYLDTLDSKLTSEYIIGNQMSLADVHTFAHLIRFDCLFYDLFGLNRKHLCEYPNINVYIQRLLNDPNFSSTVDYQEMKRGGYESENNQPKNLFSGLRKD